MAKMGYVIGTGLGPTGEGRVEPVSAYVYPQGVSLGEFVFVFCMHSCLFVGEDLIACQGNELCNSTYRHWGFT